MESGSGADKPKSTLMTRLGHLVSATKPIDVPLGLTGAAAAANTERPASIVALP